MSKKNSTKLVVLLLVLLLLIGGVVGGTLAWLIVETEPVVNTFVVGNIDLILKEDSAADGAPLGTGETWEGTMIPGTTLTKDPYVKVGKDSEECWVFVEVEEISLPGYDFTKFITYAIETGWEVVDTSDSVTVYGRKVTADDMDKNLYILKDNKVTVNSNVDENMLDQAAEGNIQLKFTAYAIQSANLKDSGGESVTKAADAWGVYLNPPEPPADETPI